MGVSTVTIHINTSTWLFNEIVLKLLLSSDQIVVRTILCPWCLDSRGHAQSVTCNLSREMCHVQSVTCNLSRAMSRAICHAQCHVQSVTRNVTCNLSRAMSRAICHAQCHVQWHLITRNCILVLQLVLYVLNVLKTLTCSNTQLSSSLNIFQNVPEIMVEIRISALKALRVVIYTGFR